MVLHDLGLLWLYRISDSLHQLLKQPLSTDKRNGRSSAQKNMEIF